MSTQAAETSTPAGSGAANAAGGASSSTSAEGSGGKAAETKASEKQLSFLEGGGSKAEGEKSGESTQQSASDDKAKADEKSGQAGELEIKLPEGIKADEAVLAEYKAAFKDIPGMTGEMASKLVAMDLQRQAKSAESQKELMEKQHGAWESELTKDKAFAGEGGKRLAEAKSNVTRAITQFCTPEQKAELVESGLGNFPPLVRLMDRIGAALQEGKSISGGGAAKAGSDDEARLKRDYPSMHDANGNPLWK